MAVVLFIQSYASGGGGGSDVTPDAVNWGNIASAQTGLGYATNEDTEQLISGIDATIQIKAAWTSTSSNPARGQWFKNGVAVQGATASPVYVNVANNDSLFFALYTAFTAPSGNYDTGIVTVTNESDGGVTLDTFTFIAQYVPGGPVGGGGGHGHIPPDGGDTPP